MSSSVHIASPLRSYTGGAATVTAEGRTVEEVLGDLERRYPGMRFRMIDEQQRIRPHIRIFVGAQEARNLQLPIGPKDAVHLLCALSGG
jgi:molybdopterin synthase sulfur carrier subunit